MDEINPGDAVAVEAAVQAVTVDASRRQREAVDPSASVWVSASAGTGKTKVLVDRVLALLVGGTAPYRILCLTFTRAAAAQMADRIQRQLGRWAVMDDARLGQSITALGMTDDEATRKRARLLFAAVLDCPGGLKIQTIHAFCESLLRRFPVEAQLQPHFRVMDELTTRELLVHARDSVLGRAAGPDPDPQLAEALGEVTAAIDLDSFGGLMQSLTFERGRIQRLLAETGIPEIRTRLAGLLGVGETETETDMVAAACRDLAFDGEPLLALARTMTAVGGKPGKSGESMLPWLQAAARDRPGLWAEYQGGFFRKDGDPSKLPFTAALRKHPDFRPSMEDTYLAEQDRLVALRARQRSLRTFRGSLAVLALGQALIGEFQRRKAAMARLDYDDLILKTRDLLGKSGAAQWVLFKLDGGLDHILVDEAQDTSPEQWEIIRLLAEEFFSGESARQGVQRTVFAVGDAKQSIYSFQRADPAAFSAMRDHFRERVELAQQKFVPVPLNVSFRSTPAVLEAVDSVFAKERASQGVADPGQAVRHAASRLGRAGRVELWPAAEPVDADVAHPWAPDPRAAAGASGSARLAREIALRIDSWIGTESLPARGRTIEAGDIMVLVRTRTAFVDTLVRELKRLSIPVAGVDRMKLAEELAVMDLMALGRFLLLPEDDLTLACVLKGPFVGFDDDDLFALAWRRKGSLWQALSARARADTADGKWRRVRDWLADFLARADHVRPFELFAAVLDEGDGRRRLLARLGVEVEDPVNEFMERALEYERVRGASLQGFLAWLDDGQAEIKRDLEQQVRAEVRIMTIHGAKGLQAPVVILPDTMSQPRSQARPSDGVHWYRDSARAAPLPLWAPRASDRASLLDGLRQKKKDEDLREYHRLLYVAMTRAEDRLVVCGWKNKNKPPDGVWYDLIEEGLKDIADPEPFHAKLDGELWGTALCLETPQLAPVESPAAPPPQEAATGPAGWMARPPAAEPAPTRPLTPSDAGEAPPVLSPLGEGGRDFRKGLLVHTLLQYLPDVPVDRRRSALETYLARPLLELTGEQQGKIADEVLNVLENPDFSALFGPRSRAEVPITGRVGDIVLSGRIDRLAVLDDRVLAVDYKTGRKIPAGIDGVADAYIRQMALYRAALGQIFRGIPVRCALLFTDGPQWVPLPSERLDASLKQLGASLDGNGTPA